MKNNRLKFIFVFIILLLVLFSLTACDDEEVIENPQEEINEYVSTNQYFDIKNLYFNEDYVNEEDEDEKGFLLYDEINFNRITISNEVLRRDCYEVEYILSIEREKNEFEEVYRTTDNTIPYILREVGHYKLLVKGVVKKEVSDVFYFNVTNQNNLPDKIEFEIYQNGEKVSSAKAGEEFTIKANLYLNNELIEKDEGYKAYWEDGTKGERFLDTGLLENSIEDTEKEFEFIIRNEKNTKVESETIFTYKLPIKENLDKIEVNYDWDTENEIDIDINKSKSFDLKNKITANYLFDNGDIEEIKINYDIPKVGDAVVLIKYENSDDYEVYNNWSVSSNGHSNVVDVNDYNFNFDKIGKGDIKVAICSERKDDIYNLFEYDDVENSNVKINIVATAITKFDVTSFFGKYRKFATKQIASDTFVSYEDENQNTEIALDDTKTINCIINT